MDGIDNKKHLKNKFFINRTFLQQINRISTRHRQHIQNPVPPSVKHICIHITHYCDLKCPNCNSLTHQAPSLYYMKISEIEKILADFNRLNKQWDIISLYGGEPTLHPQFNDIIDIFSQYKKKNPLTQIQLTTHEIKNAKKIIKKLPSWVGLSPGSRQRLPYKFKTHRSMTIAPIDLPEYQNADFSIGCWASDKCGRSVSTNGYFPCNVGLHIDRVAGLNIGIKDVKEGLESSMILQKRALCRLCGLFIYPFRYSMENKNSPTWQKILDNYNSQIIKNERY